MAGDSIIVISQIEKTADRRIKESEKKMSDVIVLEDVTKRYGNEEVVKNASMHVKEGEIYGFLGPNGAGKTTVMKLILNLAKPDCGNIRVFGEPVLPDSYTYLRYVGNLIETPCFYEKLSAGRNLRLHCEYMGIYEEGRIEQALEQVGLQGCENKIVGKFSLGMKQRLGLAAALLGRPRLLLLDEPTNGLDPAGIQEMRELICSLPEKYGMTVMVSSHLLSEIDQMATHTGIIDRGELIFQDSLAHLHEHSRKQIRLRTMDNQAACRYLTEQEIICRLDQDSILFKDMPDDRLSSLMAGVAASGAGLLRIEEQQQNLEDIFLDLTGRKVSL